MEKEFNEDMITTLMGIREVLEIASMSRSVRDGVEVRAEFFTLLSEVLHEIIEAIKKYYYKHEHLRNDDDELPFQNVKP